MSISSSHQDLFHQPSAAEKISFVRSLMDSHELNADVALALLKSIHTELAQPQPHGQNRSLYASYARMMTSLQHEMPDVHQHVVENWQAPGRVELEEASPEEGLIETETGGEAKRPESSSIDKTSPDKEFWETDGEAEESESETEEEEEPGESEEKEQGERQEEKGAIEESEQEETENEEREDDEHEQEEEPEEEPQEEEKEVEGAVEESEIEQEELETKEEPGEDELSEEKEEPQEHAPEGEETGKLEMETGAEAGEPESAGHGERRHFGWADQSFNARRLARLHAQRSRGI